MLSSNYSSYLKSTDAKRNLGIGFHRLLGKSPCPPCQGLGAKTDDPCKQQGKASHGMIQAEMLGGGDAGKPITGVDSQAQGKQGPAMFKGDSVGLLGALEATATSSSTGLLRQPLPRPQSKMFPQANPP